MYIKINIKANNNGSCKVLTEYLKKDDNTRFYDKQGNEVTPSDVIKGIDGNTQHLGKNDSKFYMLSINPSESELKHLLGEGRNASSYSDLTGEEKKKIIESLKSYTHDVMDNYAKAFNREKVTGKGDLVYYMKIETAREYHHYDKEVLDGMKKTGERKDGLNLHVHVIVSRNSTAGVKLSPNTKNRNSTFKQGDKEITRGFNYTDFIDKNINHFNESTGYKGDKYFNINDYSKPRNSQRKTTSWQGRLAKNELKRGIKGSAKHKMSQTLTGGVLKEELSMINKAQRGIQAIKMITRPPQVIAKDVALTLIKSIIGEAGKGM